MDEEYFSVADVVALHATIMRRLGQAPKPLRDEGALESAVMRARMAAFYEGADAIRQAALMAVGISQAQAFLDGNKRTAFATLYAFLIRHGLRFAGDPLAIAYELERVAERPSEREAATDEFEAWLRERVVPMGE